MVKPPDRLKATMWRGPCAQEGRCPWDFGDNQVRWDCDFRDIKAEAGMYLVSYTPHSTRKDRLDSGHAGDAKDWPRTLHSPYTQKQFDLLYPITEPTCKVTLITPCHLPTKQPKRGTWVTLGGETEKRGS